VPWSASNGGRIWSPGGERTEQHVTFPEPEFEAFFNAHYDQLVRSLTLAMGDRETARDCVQEAFIKASVRWRRVRDYDNPVGWVRRVAINQGRDMHRSSERRRRRESLNAPQENLDHAPGVAGELRLVDMLAQLPPQQRSAAALFYIDDLPISDIAKDLGISVGAVKFHLNQARRSLRQAMDGEGHRYGR
jgi:RNA polymerase sigma-70 factor, ECF subfamily